MTALLTKDAQPAPLAELVFRWTDLSSPNCAELAIDHGRLAGGLWPRKCSRRSGLRHRCRADAPGDRLLRTAGYQGSRCITPHPTATVLRFDLHSYMAASARVKASVKSVCVSKSDMPQAITTSVGVARPGSRCWRSATSTAESRPDRSA